MGKNEDEALDAVLQNQAIQKPLIEKHNGQLLKEMGDGIFAIFDSALHAVECAQDIQSSIRETASYDIRIGVHLGDVTFQEDEVYGDGVNIASRIEGEAGKGEILVSEAVYRNVKNRSGIDATFVREQSLKNIDEPVRIYRIGPAEGQTSAHESPSKESTGSNRKLLRTTAIIGAIVVPLFLVYLYLPLPSTNTLDKSIAIIPFRSLSQSEDDQYFADGIAGSIHGHLTKVGEFKVISTTSMQKFRDTNLTSPEIARELGVSYLVEGSAQRVEDEVRINVQLVDAVNDETLWTEIYTRQFSNVFAIQSEIAENIIKKLKTTLTPLQRRMIEDIPTTNTSAYDFYLLGKYHTNKVFYRIPERRIAIEYFKKATNLDPNFAQAHAWKAEAYAVLAYFAVVNNQLYADSARRAIKIALEINPDLPDALNIQAYVLRTWDRKWEESRSIFVRALQLDPNNSLLLRNYSLLLSSINELDSALNTARKANSLDPLSPLMGENLFRIYLFRNELVQATRIFESRGQDLGVEGRIVYHLLSGDTTRAADAIAEEISLANWDFEHSKQMIDYVLEFHRGGRLQQFWTATALLPPHDRYGYTVAHQIDSALNKLEGDIISWRGYTMYLLVDPGFDPLRSDPRFDQLIEDMGLTPYK